MFQAQAIESTGKSEFYRELASQLSSLLEGESDPIANAANTAALLFQMMANINWAGFYFLRDGKELVLGPFQGLPACVRIPVGRGVCGAAVEQKHSILVEDVQPLPGISPAMRRRGPSWSSRSSARAAFLACSIWTARPWVGSTPRIRPAWNGSPRSMSPPALDEALMVAGAVRPWARAR